VDSGRGWALLKRLHILIFDEATSNLDHQTAEHFAATVNALKGMVAMLNDGAGGWKENESS